MFNHIKAFKENNEKNYSLDFIVEGDLDVFKNILAENNIIILSSEEYTGDSETFGNITAIIQ